MIGLRGQKKGSKRGLVTKIEKKKNQQKNQQKETYFLEKERQVFKKVQNLGLLVLFGETMKWKDAKLNFKGADWLLFGVQSIWFKKREISVGGK